MKSDIKLVCFDLNKTLIKENTWQQLNLAMGVSEKEDKYLLGLYENEKINYEEWQNRLSQIYRKNGKGMRENILKVINNYKYSDGAKDLVKYLINKSYKIALISGSIDLLVKKVADELEINYYAAHNQIEFDENNMFNNIVCRGEDSDFKLSALQKLLLKSKN